jgi:hypothetical protein
MLVHFVKVLVVGACNFIIYFSLLKIALQLIENTDFQIGIDSAF